MRKWLFLSIVAVLGIYGCSDSSSTNTTGGLGPTGILRGEVQLIDGRGKLVQDKSGVLVQCEGTSFSTITDTAGNWEIKNLPTSTYSISFSKAGYYTFKNTSFQFVGGGIQLFKSLGLFQPMAFSATLDFVDLQGPKNAEVQCYGHTTDNTPGNIGLYLHYIISRSPTIELDNNRTISTTYEGQATRSSPPEDSSLSFISPAPLNYLRQLFHTGDTIYVRVFPYLNIQSYYDVYAKKDVTTGYGPGSNVLSAVMP